VLAREAFPVQGEAVLWPSVGVGLVAIGAIALRIDPFAPLRRAPSKEVGEAVDR
jgi:hypothetical protein